MNPFLKHERPLAMLADAKKRTEEKLQTAIEDDLSLSIFTDLVKDANARFAVNVYGDDAGRIFNDTLFAHSISLEPLRTAYKCALGIRFGKMPKRIRQMQTT